MARKNLSSSRLLEFVGVEEKTPVWIGLDVHKRSYHVALRRADGLCDAWVTAADPDLLVRQLSSISERISAIVYEAGPTGYSLERVLKENGYPVSVVAPSQYLVAPVRPNQKSKYPLTNIDDYIKWTTDNGMPFDAWLRVHVRAGARIIKPCHEAMTIRGTRAKWEEWTGMKFPQSGKYYIDGALNPIQMDIEKDEGVYIEPNVWMAHPLG